MVDTVPLICSRLCGRHNEDIDKEVNIEIEVYL